MPEALLQQVTAPESAAQESESADQAVAVATDTTEQVAETDEQKNARELAEQQARSERRARGVQKRLDELTAEKYEARARAERAERMLEQAMRGNQPAPAAEQPDAEPKREQYANYDDWVAALAEHRAAKRAEKIIADRFGQVHQQQTDFAQQQEVMRLRNQFAARQQDFAKKNADYFDVVQTEDVRIPNEAAAFLHTMEDAPAVIYHMAKNPEVAQRLWNEPPIRQAMLLGELSAQLKTPPKVSNAPPPGKPTGARSGESNEPPSDYQGYLKWRAKQRSMPKS